MAQSTQAQPAEIMTREKLKYAVIGGCFLGSGGGGTLESALRLIKHFTCGEYYPQDTVEVVKVEHATEGDAVVVAYIGAPAKINHADYPDGPVQAVIQVRNHLHKIGRQLAYIVPAETGALGFAVASLVAAKLGLKVIDADGAGRAVPSLPQLTFSLVEGLSPNPAIVVNQDKNLCIEVGVTILPTMVPNGQNALDAKPHAAKIEDVSKIIDNLMRPIISEPDFDQYGGLALWIMDHAQMLKALPIRNTLTKACALGKALEESLIRNSDQLVHFLNNMLHTPARRIFGPARLIDARITTKGGFDFGEIDFKDNKTIYTVCYQNESLLIRSKAQASPLCTAPDSIAYFLEPTETGPNQPNIFSNGDLLTEDGSPRKDLADRYFSIIGVSVDDILWKKETTLFKSFRELLRQMGYAEDPIPVIPR